jgi:hypothetical protein
MAVALVESLACLWHALRMLARLNDFQLFTRVVLRLSSPAGIARVLVGTESRLRLINAQP